jgi:hypothetical protein
VKKILISLFLFAALSANAQSNAATTETDSVEVQLVQLPDSTALGTPTGKKVSKEIGTSGGTIISDDGRIELVFPPDALDKATEISIQPVTTMIPNGNKSYQFEPSGLQFKKPVQIIFHYTEEEAGICPPELKFMALQDHKGKWEYMDYNDWDSTTKLLKGSISHFSTFVDGAEVQLSASEITLRAGKTHSLSLNVVQPPPSPDAEGQDELPPLPPNTSGNRQVLWKVNDQTGGSAKHGTVMATRGNVLNATYKAPAKLTADTITVKLELNNVAVRQIRIRAGRGWFSRRVVTRSPVASFSCKVKLYDEYKVTVSHNIEVDGGQMTDTSIFHLRIGLEDRASISDIYNRNAIVRIRQTRCRAIYANEAVCVGMINVTGIRTSNLTFSPDGSVRVFIFFTAAPSVFPVINFPPCGINKANVTTPSFGGITAFPVRLNFEAKNEKQMISLGKREGTVVQRIDPEDVTAIIEPIRD